MAHKCFISFKTHDIAYKLHLQNLGIDMIDKSLDNPISSSNDEYVMRKIREEYLSDSTVTIFLIGEKSSEDSPFENQYYIKKELQASLYNASGNTRSGILGVVLPSVYDKVYLGEYTCTSCGLSHKSIGINDSTVVREFSHNYFIPKPSGCGWNEDERYCVLISWDNFCSNPEEYINKAFAKRTASIASKVRVRP